MRKEYNFTNSKSNPYVKRLKKQITMRVEKDTIEYFKQISTTIGIPYQNLINLYLTDCAQHHRKISLNWK